MQDSSAPELNGGEFLACACEYQEGTGKKDTTLETGNGIIIIIAKTLCNNILIIITCRSLNTV